VQGCVLVVAVLFMVLNLVVDIMYGFLDPRICYD
jgi:peptide/nickel transport system permease protein